MVFHSKLGQGHEGVLCYHDISRQEGLGNVTPHAVKETALGDATKARSLNWSRHLLLKEAQWQYATELGVLGWEIVYHSGGVQLPKCQGASTNSEDTKPGMVSSYCSLSDGLGRSDQKGQVQPGFCHRACQDQHKAYVELVIEGSSMHCNEKWFGEEDWAFLWDDMTSHTAWVMQQWCRDYLLSFITRGVNGPFLPKPKPVH